jgi:hypothetical protein
MEHLGKFSIASMAHLKFDSLVFYVELELSSWFDLLVSYELAWASSLTKWAKVVVRLVKKLIKASRVEPAHEFLTHSPTHLGSSLSEEGKHVICMLADQNATRASTVNKPLFLASLPGIGTQTLGRYSFFLTNLNFIIAYILCFLFTSLNVGKTLDTKRSRSFQHSDFDKSNLAQPSQCLHEDLLFSGRC